jgi:hypothetical protein
LENNSGDAERKEPEKSSFCELYCSERDYHTTMNAYYINVTAEQSSHTRRCQGKKGIGKSSFCEVYFSERDFHTTLNAYYINNVTTEQSSHTRRCQGKKGTGKIFVL